LRYKEDSVCLYFFCDDKSEMRRTELQILRTLVYQLTHLVPRNLQRETIRIVLDMQEEVKKDRNAPRELFDSSNDLWEVFLRICRAKISGLREIRCIIDALDECEPESRKSLLQRIRGFYASSTSATPSTFLKVVTSTRSYPEIISQLPPTEEVQLRGTAGVSRDVEGFIEAECSDLAGRFSLSEDFVAQLSKAMKARADGMFLWATLSMDCVRGSLQAWETRPKPWVFSTSLVPSGGLDALLAGLFHKMNPVASKALKWATLSFRPLSKDEIASINKYESASTNRVCRTLEEHELNCSPLGYFDGQGVLHIYHQSIKDYIRKSVVKEPEDLQLFAEVCVATLTSSAAPGMGLQQYACLHWFDHIIPTLKLSDKLVHRLRDFYSPEKKCFAAWLRTFRQLPQTLLISDAAMWLADDTYVDTAPLTPLHLAAFCNQHDLVEKLLSSRHRRASRVSKVLPWHNNSIWSLTRPINLKDRSGRTALCIACSRGNEAVARLLLNCNDVQADSRDPVYGRTPLSFAAEGGHEAVVRLLLDRNDVQADSRDGGDRTPLSFAAEHGHEAVVRLLLDRNDVQADFQGNCGRTPLSLAAEGGHEAVVGLLLDRNDVQADSSDEAGQTPLSFAAECGHEAVVRLLLDRNDVQADSRDPVYGRTPLSFAAEGGHEAVVRLLLDRNDVQADSRDDVYGRTPLSFAASRGHEAVVRLLLDRNDVQADSRDDVYGRRPLSFAAEGGHEAVVRLLLGRNDVQADSRDDDGQTPLLWAALRGHEAIVRLLLDRNDVQADSRYNYGQTPLSFAAEHGHEAVVRLLLDRNDVQADSRDDNGRTPLSFAARFGHEAIVRLLLDRNDVQADSRDDNGRTPLSFAAENGQEAVVRLLLDRNDVQADSRDGGGRTPLSFAAEDGHEAVVRLLRDRCFNI
jgi:ankyrin repeat protein